MHKGTGMPDLCQEGCPVMSSAIRGTSHHHHHHHHHHYSIKQSLLSCESGNPCQRKKKGRKRAGTKMSGHYHAALGFWYSLECRQYIWAVQGFVVKVLLVHLLITEYHCPAKFFFLLHLINERDRMSLLHSNKVRDRKGRC